ncbi:MAG: methyl-accepting chemotaxis protein [Vicinamibacterales bacterium]
MSSIRTRTLLGTGVGMALAMVIALAGIVGLRGIVSRFDELADRATPAHVLLLNIDRDSYQAQLALERALTATDPADREEQEAAFRENAEQTAERFAAYREVALGAGEETARWPAYERARADWLAGAEVLLDADQPIDTTALSAEQQAFDAARDLIDALAGDFYEGFIDASNQGVRTTATNQQALMLLAALAALACGSFVLRMISRGLRPLRALADAAERMAEGATDVDLPVARHDDEVGRLTTSFGTLAGYLRDTSTSLRAAAVGDLTVRPEVRSPDDVLGSSTTQLLASLTSVVGAMRHAVDRLGSSSTQVLTLSTSLEDSADATSGAANGVAAASHQMHQAIGEVARNAAEAVDVAGGAVELADRARTIVARLDQSSVEVGSVLAVINDIAAQTNLLALNATIEAARAGEAGRGFAVVADEVKQLATQTTEATDGVRKRVDAIQSDTANATAAIAEVGTIIETIAERMHTIAAAVEEQELTTNEITERINGVSILADGNRQITQQAGGAASDLTHLATQLDELVATFTLPAA